jgi:hypothetical protein
MCRPPKIYTGEKMTLPSCTRPVTPKRIPTTNPLGPHFGHLCPYYAPTSLRFRRDGCSELGCVLACFPSPLVLFTALFSQHALTGTTTLRNSGEAALQSVLDARRHHGRLSRQNNRRGPSRRLIRRLRSQRRKPGDQYQQCEDDDASYEKIDSNCSSLLGHVGSGVREFIIGPMCDDPPGLHAYRLTRRHRCSSQRTMKPAQPARDTVRQFGETGGCTGRPRKLYRAGPHRFRAD